MKSATVWRMGMSTKDLIDTTLALIVHRQVAPRESLVCRILYKVKEVFPDAGIPNISPLDFTSVHVAAAYAMKNTELLAVFLEPPKGREYVMSREDAHMRLDTLRTHYGRHYGRLCDLVNSIITEVVRE